MGGWGCDYRGTCAVRRRFPLGVRSHHAPRMRDGVRGVCLVAGAVLVGCSRDRAAPAPSPSRAPAPVPSPALIHPPPMEFPHRPAGCDYRVEPPHAGRLAVTAHVDRPGAVTRARHLHLTVVGDASRSVVAQWNTDLDDESARVRFRPIGSGLWGDAAGFSFPLPGAVGVRHHEVHLCGLSPDQSYQYAVQGDARTWRFHTAPDGPDPVTVLVAGDARTHPEVWGAVARSAMHDAPDLLLFTGDAVADGASMALWARFFDEAESLLATTPGYWADGNHEGMAAVYYDQFALPDNGDGAHREHWYAATYGPVRLVALNDVTVSSEDIRGPQREFLDATLRAVDRARTPWVFAMHHQPMHTDAVGHRPDSVTRLAWGPLFDRSRVDVDLSGHVHNYETTEPLRSDGTVVAEGAGTRYFVYGGAGAPLYDFHAQGRWVHRRERTHGYALAHVNRDHLRWEARRVDGSVIETLDVPWVTPPR